MGLDRFLVYYSRWNYWVDNSTNFDLAQLYMLKKLINWYKKYLIKRIKKLDQDIYEIYGPDSQEYLNWKDELNRISIEDKRFQK